MIWPAQELSYNYGRMAWNLLWLIRYQQKCLWCFKVISTEADAETGKDISQFSNHVLSWQKFIMKEKCFSCKSVKTIKHSRYCLIACFSAYHILLYICVSAYHTLQHTTRAATIILFSASYGCRKWRTAVKGGKISVKKEGDKRKLCSNQIQYVTCYWHRNISGISSVWSPWSQGEGGLFVAPELLGHLDSCCLPFFL